jgi:vancomycin resistance protein VanJ
MPSSIHSSKRPLWTRLIAALCLTYVAGVLVFFALRALLPHQPWPLVLLDNFAPFLFAPLLLTLPLTLLIRSKAAARTSLVALLFFAALYGPLFLPRSRPAIASADGTLTVMTFNLQFDHPQPGQVIAAIENEDADVVAVQELVPSSAELLREQLGARYPHLILEPEASDSGLLSRYPISHSEWFYMAENGKTALHAILDVNGRPVHILVIHPPPPYLSWHKSRWLPAVLDGFSEEKPESQVMDVARRVAALEGTVLVMGDFNLTDRSRAYTRMAALLKDAYREAGRGFGFTFPHSERAGRLPIPGPLVRLDYVFHSADLYAASARVGCEGGSNHCYLVVELTHLSSERR